LGNPTTAFAKASAGRPDRKCQKQIGEGKANPGLSAEALAKAEGDQVDLRITNLDLLGGNECRRARRRWGDGLA